MYNWYLRQKLSIKLILPNIIIVLILIFAGLFVFFIVKQQLRLQHTYRNEMNLSQRLNILIQDYAIIQSSLYKSVTFSFAGLDPEKAALDITSKMQIRPQLEKTIDSVKLLPQFTQQQTTFDSIRKYSDQYFNWVIEVTDNLDDPVAAAANMVTTESKFNKLDSNLSNIISMIENQMNQDALLIERNTSSIISWILISITFITIIAIGISIVNQFMFKTFIDKTRNDVAIIANGNLTHTINIKSKDEFGLLAQSIENMRSTFLSLLTGLQQNIHQLLGESKKLTTLSEHLTQDVSTIDNRTTIIKSAGNEMSSHAQVMASDTQRVSKETEATSWALSEISSSIREVSNNCAKEAAMAKASADKVDKVINGMNALDAASKDIGKILKIIDDIAGRTRLLALNATIEAASAGEAGLGFAVVAKEVKDLASKSNDAASQIQDKISAIQTETSNTILSVNEINETICQFTNISISIASAVEEQVVTTSKIAESVQTVSSSSNTLVNGIDEIANRSLSVVNAITDVGSVISGTSEEAKKTAHSAFELAKIANELSEAIKKYQL
jgi:methyl-accepting chemotaxis protein